MAEFNELSLNNDTTNGSGFHESGKSINCDLYCNVDTKLTKTENCSDKETTCIKHESVAEFEELTVKNETINGNRPHVSGTNEIRNNLHCTDNQKFLKTEEVADIEDVSLLKEENKLLKLTNDLQEVIINLLQQKSKLLDIRNRKFKNDIINSIDDVQKAIDETLRNFLKSSGALQIDELQNILKIVESTNTELLKDSMDNIEQILEETHSKFLKYQKVYTTCKTYLENVLQKAEKALNINTVPNNFQIKRSALFSILEDLRLRLINFRLASMKKAFDEFDTILQDYTKMNGQNMDKIELLLTAFEKAEFAYREIKSLIVEVLKFEFTEV